MNPDTPSFDDNEGNDAALEVQLRSLPQPVLPSAWRESILRTARRPVWPWLTRPVRWGLAACWAAIGMLQLSMPPGPAPLPAGALASPPPQDFRGLDEHWLAGLENNPPDSPPP